jgi:hypothetical protein
MSFSPLRIAVRHCCSEAQVEGESYEAMVTNTDQAIKMAESRNDLDLKSKF